MAQLKGVNVLLYADVNGTETLIGGQKNATLSLSADTIETTAKGDDFRKYLQSFKSWTVSCDGLLVTGDSGFDALKQAFENGSEVSVVIKDADGKFNASGSAIVTSMEYSFPLDDMAGISVELQGTGSLTVTLTT